MRLIQLLIILCCLSVKAQDAQKPLPPDSEIFNTAGIDVKPEYPGGMQDFYNHIMGNYKTPKSPGGQVILTFVIEKNGKMTEFDVIRDPGYGLAKEAIRVLKKAKRWIPGRMNNKPVRVMYSLPINIPASE